MVRYGGIAVWVAGYTELQDKVHYRMRAMAHDCGEEVSLTGIYAYHKDNPATVLYMLHITIHTYI
jgi:hypothetical protein